MTEPNQEKTIESQINNLAIDQTVADIGLLKEYQNINKRAAQGELITAEDFRKAEQKYNIAIQHISETAGQVISEEAAKTAHNQEEIIPIAKDLSNKLSEQSATYLDIYKKTHPDVLSDIENVANLDNSFLKQHKNAPEKNTSISSNIDSNKELVTDLLSKNNGVAIADIHTKSDSLKLIADNMADYKNAGVDTVYMEIGNSEYQSLSSLSIEQLKEKINSRTPEEISAAISENKKHFHSDVGHDSYGDMMKVFLAAKENGVEIISIDKTGSARNFESRNVEHRISSSNYEFTENIEQDRKQNHKEGKYLVFGGENHFGEKGQQRGLVDEALGIPVVAFTEENNTKITKGTNPNGADFYIPPTHSEPAQSNKQPPPAQKSEQTSSLSSKTAAAIPDHIKALAMNACTVKLECTNSSVQKATTSAPTQTVTVAKAQDGHGVA